MKKKTIINFSILGIALMFIFNSCKKDSVAVTATEKTDSLVVHFSPTESFAFFSFKDGALISNTDSASTKWDFGMRLTTFILNSGAYGPGNAGVVILDSIYSNVKTAPETGYAYDTTQSKIAIPSYKLWADYNASTYSFVPKAGKTFIFKTADSHYVKMEILSADYEPFTGYVPLKIIYKFRYTYQSNGTKTF